MSELAEIFAPVFLCIVFGFLWRQSSRLFDMILVSTLIYKIAIPCLVIAVFSKVRPPTSLLVDAVVVMTGVYVLTAGFVLGTLRFFRGAFRSYLPLMTSPLVNAIGLPLSFLALGELGLAIALVFFVFSTFCTLIISAVLEPKQTRLFIFLGEPIFWAFIAGCFLIWLDFGMPSWAHDTMKLLGGMAFSLLLIYAGYSLGKFHLTWSAGEITLSIYRLLVGLLIGIIIVEVFRLTGVVRAAAVLYCGLPVGLSHHLFRNTFKEELKEPTSVPLISTIVSAVSLPLLVVYFV